MDPKVMDAMVDSLFKGQSYGRVAKRLVDSGMDINSLRTNAVLRKEEWKQFDTKVVDIAKRRLVGVASLRRRGLEFNISGDGLATTVLEHETVSDMTDATMSMDGISRSDNDRLVYEIGALPLPIIHKDFDINARVLAASRKRGTPLDTAQAGVAARKVAEKAETLLYQGSSSYTWGGGTIYGLCDHPSRNTGSLTGDWSDAGVDGGEIVADVLRMKQELLDAGFYGPYILDVPANYETKLDEDQKANSERTIRERLAAIASIAEIKVADKLTNHNVLLYQASEDVARMVVGLEIQTVEWDSDGKMRFNFKVMTILVPQVRADQDGNSGVCHYVHA